MLFIFFPFMFFLVGINFSVNAETAGRENSLFPYSFSAVLTTGMEYGQSTETVYKYPDNEVLMSQLLWDIKPVFYAASSLEFSRTNLQEGIGFFSRLALKAGFPGKSGLMEDRDWIAADSDELTHFSSHDNYAQGSFSLDFSAGLSFPLPSRFLLKVYGTLFYMSYSWVARDGYFNYQQVEESAFGAVLIYSQKWLIFAPGVSLYAPLFSFLGFELSLQFGPAAFCVAQDDHLLRKVQFVDTITGGLYFKPRGELIFFPGKKISFSFYAAYPFLTGRGKAYSRSAENTELIRNGNYDASGAGYSALDLGISLRIGL
ncbi:MAG: omptin family outer membrane protease [Treponema sp.]|nr:omptin family outer membrane protease [Treponema sp.]